MSKEDLIARSVAGTAIIVGVVIGLLSLRNTLHETHLRYTVRRGTDFLAALNQYHSKTGRYPVSMEAPIERIMQTSLGKTVLRGDGVRVLNAKDGWGRSFRYLSSGETYVLWSLGENGAIDRMPGGGEYEDHKYDFIVASGAVWQGPSGFF